jgi:hypothetical protein
MKKGAHAWTGLHRLQAWTPLSTHSRTICRQPGGLQGLVQAAVSLMAWL